MSPANSHPVLADALDRGRRSLDEVAAKKLLAGYDVPCVPEAVATSPRQAAQVAAEVGFPVVLKARAAELLHKSDRGLVRVALGDAAAVAQAARDMAAALGDDLEGFVVQPQVEGRRELLVGAHRDPVFGPVVLVGVGGVLTEALDDVVLRVAPLAEDEALAMLDELRAARLLDSYRGEAPVDRRGLARALAGLGRLLLEQPRVQEVDVNPLIVDREGRLSAVDALVTLGPAAVAAPDPAPGFAGPALERIFAPRSVAFVGASGRFGKWGYTLPSNVLAGGFQGQVELVNPRGGSLFGLPVRTDIAQLPSAVDLAVLSIPADGVAPALRSLAGRGVEAALVITAGFAETGAVGRSQEAQLVALAAELGMILVGPNTMGVCNPHVRFYCTGAHVRPEAGGTALLSQSGNMGVQLLSFAERQGLGIRAFCGTGNEALIGMEELLEHFGRDPLTEVVVLYVESVRDGTRFLQAARAAGRRKPVVLLKGGRTGAGQKAAATHTGALASDRRVFDAACRQVGIVQVDQPMELLDASAAFSALPLPRGDRVAIMTWGGGWGVVAADLCAEQGLCVPDLSPDLVTRLDRLLPPYWSRENPVDLVGEPDPELPARVLEALLEWQGADAVISLGMMGRGPFVDRMADSAAQVDPALSARFLRAVRDNAREFEHRHLASVVALTARYGKPVIGVSLVPDSAGRTVYRQGDGQRALFFSSPERAVKVLARMWEYARFLGRVAP